MKFIRIMSILLAFVLISSTLTFQFAFAISAMPQVIISNCDTAWTTGGAVVNTSNKVEGTGSIGATTADGLILTNTFEPINIALAESACAISMWIYLDDATGIQDAAIELNSGGATDVDEYQWGYNSSIGWHFDSSKPKLITGWNYVIFPFSVAVKHGTPNKNALNFMRAYCIYGGLTKTILFDDVRVVDYTKTIKSVISPIINTTVGTAFEDVIKPATVDALTYSGAHVSGIPVLWGPAGFVSEKSAGCIITGSISPSVLLDNGLVVTKDVPINANVIIKNLPETPPEILISNCDTDDFTAQVDTVNKAEGTGSASKIIQGPGAVIFDKSFVAGNTNITEQNGALDMWIYIENASPLLLTNGNTQVELNSNASFDDANEYSWAQSDLNLKNGWNRIILKLSNATKTGNIDIDNLNYFRYYTVFNETNIENTIKLDDVKLISVTQPITDIINSINDTCDSNNGWAAEYAVDTTNQKEGSGCLSVTADNGLMFIKNISTATNPGVTEINGALSLWIYFEKITDMTDFQIEITSSGTSDADEYAWGFSQLRAKQGWNYVTLRLNKATKTGNPEIKAINYFRIYDIYNGTNTVKIDDIKIQTVEVINYLEFDNCDNSAGWAAPYAIDETNAKEGTGCFTSTADKFIDYVKDLPAPMNFDVTEANGVVSLWVYFEKITDITDFQIEFTSSGKNDVDEYAWGFSQLNAKKGWNKIILKFKDATKTGNPNLKAINHFRIYEVYSGTNTIKLDDIRIINLTKSPVTGDKNMNASIIASLIAILICGIAIFLGRKNRTEAKNFINQ